jgi:nucleotide-binding universal stress UspA family protein
MAAITRALFPIDLSLNYRPPSLTTRRMFDRQSTEIVMLHAIEEPSRSSRGMDMDRSMAQMEFLARKEFEHAQLSSRVERGRAADCILDYVQKHEVDVVVMPAGDRESLGRGSLGHVTEEVLSVAPCAVWTERRPASAESVRHICCAVRLDGSDESVMRRAAEATRDLSAELTVIYAMVPESPMAPWWDADAVEQEVRIARMRVEELRERFEPAAHVHVEAGRLESVVSRKMARLDAGLLVTAGSGSAIVAAAVSCPVLRVSTPLAKVARPGQWDSGTAFAATA